MNYMCVVNLLEWSVAADPDLVVVAAVSVGLVLVDAGKPPDPVVVADHVSRDGGVGSVTFPADEQQQKNHRSCMHALLMEALVCRITNLVFYWKKIGENLS